jgi:hypothetical protein
MLKPDALGDFSPSTDMANKPTLADGVALVEWVVPLLKAAIPVITAALGMLSHRSVPPRRKFCDAYVIDGSSWGTAASKQVVTALPQVTVTGTPHREVVAESVK